MRYPNPSRLEMITFWHWSGSWRSIRLPFLQSSGWPSYCLRLNLTMLRGHSMTMLGYDDQKWKTCVHINLQDEEAAPICTEVQEQGDQFKEIMAKLYTVFTWCTCVHVYSISGYFSSLYFPLPLLFLTFSLLFFSHSAQARLQLNYTPQ